jgi:hypothetical protein
MEFSFFGSQTCQMHRIHGVLPQFANLRVPLCHSEIIPFTSGKQIVRSKLDETGSGSYAIDGFGLGETDCEK